MKKELFEVGSPEIPQVLWTLPVEKVTNEKGEDELITPPLDGTILPGITRDSLLTLM